MKFGGTYCILLLFTASIVASLAGCGGGTLAQITPIVEETKTSVTFFNDYAAGMEMARQQKKPTLLFFSLPDNVGSERMLETTFSSEEIKRLAEWLICIRIDGTKEQVLCEAFQITSFPTIILSNAKNTEVSRLVGRQTSDQLAVQIQVLLQTTALRPLNTVER